MTNDRLLNDFDVEGVLHKLSPREQGVLLSGSTLSKTAGLPKRGIPALLLSDGPHACRGPLGSYIPYIVSYLPRKQQWLMYSTNAYPCGMALAASFDGDLLHRLGEQMSREALAKRVHVVLGPTVNIARSPLAGRGFEFFSEDPYLSGKLAARYVQGIQSKGVAACMKHFVCNEQEYEKHKASSNVSARALRETYLEPFRIAVREAAPRAFMTAYNPLNGIHCSENEVLLKELLREEWGWQGCVVSDWGGTHSTAAAIRAGLDLEMPAASIWRTERQIVSQIECGKITLQDVADRARNVLGLVRCAHQSDVPFDDDYETCDTAISRALLREAAGKTITLLKNERNILPLDRKTLRSLAIIGDHAQRCNSSGGGSAAVPVETYNMTPLSAITGLVADYGIEVGHAVGSNHHMYVPSIDKHLRHPDGTNKDKIKVGRFEGWAESPHSQWKTAKAGLVVDTHPSFAVDHSSEKICFLDGGYGDASIDTEARFARYTSIFRPDETGSWEFGLASVDQALVFLDGNLIIDYTRDLEDGTLFFSFCHREKRVTIPHLEADREYCLEVRTWDTGRYGSVTISMATGFQLGAVKTLDNEAAVKAASDLARKSDAAIIIVGLDKDYESEGYDRMDLALPGTSDQLIREVLAVNPRTIVVTQSGMPVSMPWADECGALIHQFYGGTGAGQGLADVIFGLQNPSAKLPVTFPKLLSDTPAYENFGPTGPDPLAAVEYTEGIFIGYRHYDTYDISPLFPFGHGLSYTEFAYSALEVTAIQADGSFAVSFCVQNTGSRAGAEISLVYVCDLVSSVPRPVKELKGFAKNYLEPGQILRVELKMDRFALAFWDDQGSGSWVAEAGNFEVVVGGGPGTLDLKSTVNLGETLRWRGL